MLGCKTGCRFLAMIALLGACPLLLPTLRASTDVDLAFDPPGPDYIVGEKFVVRIKSLGRTDCPPPSQGVGPWFRTGRRHYLWTVNQKEPVVAMSSPVSGTITSFDSMRVSLGYEGGSFSIGASVQEEWRDSTGKTVYWPPFR